MSSLVPVSSSMYRVLVADVLPYEHPVFFNNRYFIRLLKGWHVEMDEQGNLYSQKKIKGNKQRRQISTFLSFIQKTGIEHNKCFQYEIAKDDDGPKQSRRTLTLIHPYDQIRMAYFYKKYHSVIIDFCSKSHFSLRFPYKVATHHRKKKGYPRFITDDEIEMEPDEGLRHYFAYRRFKNINQFYESFDFLNSERSYTHMLKLDVRHCFDNISPDLLAKALYDTTIENCQQTIASDFGSLMRGFMSENAGIIIGPEFSRIFAEMIMQKIDFLVELRMKFKGYRNKQDYVFYRYVDDGFLFYDSELVRCDFEAIYKDVLSEYGLSINTRKEKYKEYRHKPFLEGITAAKIKIRVLVRDTFSNRLTTLIGLLKADRDSFQSPLFLSYKSFIANIRSIIYEYEVHYKDVTAYTLAQISIRLDMLLKEYNSLLKEYVNTDIYDTVSYKTKKIKELYYDDFIDFTSNLIETLFFLASCDLRMSTSIKVISIIGRMQLFIKGRFKFDNGITSMKFNAHKIDVINQKINLEIIKIIKNSRVAFRYPMETLNFLELEKAMTPKNKIPPKLLNDYVESIKDKLNFFSVFEVLHFTKLDEVYNDVNGLVMQWLLPKLEAQPDNTESCYAQLEFLALFASLKPETQKKNENHIKQINKDLIEFVKSQKHLFINWDKYNLLSELDNMNSQEVY